MGRNSSKRKGKQPKQVTTKKRTTRSGATVIVEVVEASQATPPVSSATPTPYRHSTSGTTTGCNTRRFGTMVN